MTEIENLIHNFEDINYWKDMCPDLTVSNNAHEYVMDPYAIDEANITQSMGQLKDEGFFTLKKVLDISEVAPLLNAIKTIKDQGIPPIFSFLFDEYWAVVMRLSSVFKPIFGEEYWILPDFWAFYVTKGIKNRGWWLHRDLVLPVTQPDGMPKALTFWVALTEANPDNSCMYVLPKCFDKNFNHDLNKVDVDVEHVRAVPAKAGDILFWNPNIIHWGSHSSDYATNDRVSFAFYLQKKRARQFISQQLS